MIIRPKKQIQTFSEIMDINKQIITPSQTDEDRLKLVARWYRDNEKTEEE